MTARIRQPRSTRLTSRRVAPCALPLAAALAAALPAPAAAQDAPVPGEATFRAVCATCHSIHPPAAQAPPMAHIARHYLGADTARDAVIERIVRWVREPAEDRSLLPPMARERWGLMPAVLLPEAQLRDVAAYVLTLAEPAAGGTGRGMGQGRGGMHRGGMHRGGSAAGSAAGSADPAELPGPG